MLMIGPNNEDFRMDMLKYFKVHLSLDGLPIRTEDEIESIDDISLEAPINCVKENMHPCFDCGRIYETLPAVTCHICNRVVCDICWEIRHDPNDNDDNDDVSQRICPMVEVTLTDEDIEEWNRITWGTMIQ